MPPNPDPKRPPSLSVSLPDALAAALDAEVDARLAGGLGPPRASYVIREALALCPGPPSGPPWSPPWARRRPTDPDHKPRRVVGVTLTPALAAKVDALAPLLGSRSDVARSALAWYLSIPVENRPRGRAPGAY